MLEKLIGSSKVELRFTPNEQQRDRYERFIAQLFVLRGEERLGARAHEPRGPGAILFVQGTPRLRPSAAGEGAGCPHREKRSFRKGSYAVLQAANTDALSKQKGSFQLVEGTVLTVGRKSQ